MTERLIESQEPVRPHPRSVRLLPGWFASHSAGLGWHYWHSETKRIRMWHYGIVDETVATPFIEPSEPVRLQLSEQSQSANQDDLSERLFRKSEKDGLDEHLKQIERQNIERYLAGKGPLFSQIRGSREGMIRYGKPITFEEAWKDYPQITENYTTSDVFI